MNQNTQINGLTVAELSEVMDLKYEDAVKLTKEEVSNGRMRKREMKKKVKTFINTPIYRTYHASMVNMMQIIELMPKKTVKISDIMLSNLIESIRWSASAYEIKDNYLKLNSIRESISLMYAIRICVNTSSNTGLIGKNKSTQLGKSIDDIIRQLVAWRSSLEEQGGNGE